MYVGRTLCFVSLGARRIFSRGGQIRGLETKVPQRGPGWSANALSTLVDREKPGFQALKDS